MSRAVLALLLTIFFAFGAIAQDCEDVLKPDLGILAKVLVDDDGSFNVVVEGDTAYMAAAGYVYAVDVSDPGNPAIIGQYELSFGTGRLGVNDGLICLMSYNDGLQFLDATDPANIAPVKTIPEVISQNEPMFSTWL